MLSIDSVKKPKPMTSEKNSEFDLISVIKKSVPPILLRL